MVNKEKNRLLKLKFFSVKRVKTGKQRFMGCIGSTLPRKKSESGNKLYFGEDDLFGCRKFIDNTNLEGKGR
jgi:hypothetical protein